MSNQSERIAWVDVLKFLGIWAIYIGHFGDKAGRVYPFVFTYHVPLFFFAAGFFAERNLKDTPLTFLRKKTMQLMVPYLFFSAIALVFFTIQNDWDVKQAGQALMGFLFGIRDQIVAGSLWFIPCLYIIMVSDYFVRKLIRSQGGVLVFACGAFVSTQTLLPHNPAIEPSWFMNVDSALYFYLYYALGSALFPLLIKEPVTALQRTVSLAFAWLAVGVTLITFFLTPAWFLGKLTTLAPWFGTFQLTPSIMNVLIALALIYCNIIVARGLSSISYLHSLGRETLALCGTEDVTKQMVTQLLAMVNLKARLINPFITIIFSLLCLVIARHTLIEFFNSYFPQALGKSPSRT